MYMLRVSISRWWIVVIMCLHILFIAGCVHNPPQSTDGSIVWDATHTEVMVPKKATRIIPIGVGTEDIILSLVGGERVVAIGEYPNNCPHASQQVPNRIKMSVESILQCQPDLVIVPDWVNPELVTTLRGLGVSVYVFATPKTIADTEETITQLAGIVHEEEKGRTIVNDMQARLQRVQQFTQSIGSQKIVAQYGTLGLTGGIRSTFASICEAIHARDAASLMGLGMYDTGNREDLLHINPDVIIMPSNIFDKGATYESYTENLYSDPALQDVKAVAQHQIYVVDARWLTSYSQYVVNAVEAVAQAVYGYYPVVSTH